MDKVKLGVIGIGNMGSAHCQHIMQGLCPEVELVAVADTNPARLEWAKENLAESVVHFATAEELLDSGLVQAVIIAVPHYFHPPIAIKAFERNIHVLTEKPAGVYTKQVLEMNKAAEKSGVVFGIMWNQRTNHIFRKMKELVDSGKYGQIRRTNWIVTTWFRSQAYYDSGDWRATWCGEGGGVLMNQCPHQLDLFQWICGMPKTVQAKIQYGKWHNIEVEDEVSAFVQYENGATGVFIASTGEAQGTNRFEILLDRAKLIAEHGKLQLFEFESTIDEFTYSAGPSGLLKAVSVDPETDGKDTEHVGVVNAFAAAILRGEPLVAEGKEGIREISLANAMYLSDWLGREVQLPLNDKQYYKELSKRIAISKKKQKNKPQSESAVKNTTPISDASERWKVRW